MALGIKPKPSLKWSNSIGWELKTKGEKESWTKVDQSNSPCSSKLVSDTIPP